MQMSIEEVQNLVQAGKIKVSDKDMEILFPSKASKYKNKKTEFDGIIFDSKFEAERYASLKLLEKAGAIEDLQLQVPFELIPSYKYKGKTIRKTVYKADFVYTDPKTKKKIVEDTKGYVTKEYALKKKLLLFKYPDIDFREVRKKDQ